MNCPHCNICLEISERKNIEIDYCPKCRGVWLDRGELDKLLEYSAREQQPVSRSDHGRDGHHDERDYKPRHRKKSLLGELFDF